MIILIEFIYLHIYYRICMLNDSNIFSIIYNILSKTIKYKSIK